VSDFLAAVALASSKRVASARQIVSETEMKQRALAEAPTQPLDLRAGGFDIIAEIKRKAPSSGTLHAHDGNANAFVVGQAAAYTRGGASAVSVLTEPTAFNGSLDDLQLVADTTPLPTMRKDFIVDPYQVYEARVHHASGVLLIARLLNAETLPVFLDAAAVTRQFVLLEIFDESELDILASAIQHATARGVFLLAGVNARNLVTLQVDTNQFARLSPQLPSDVPHVAESGLATTSDIRGIASLGYRAALIGSALMRSDDPARLLKELSSAGREVTSQCT
jgi:indole-3-glycerol phosphate synthase